MLRRSAHPSSSNLERGYRDTSPSLGGPSPSKRHPPPSSPSLSSTKRRPRLLRRLGIACGCLFFGLLLLLWRLESVVVLAYFKYRDSSYDHPSPSCRLRKPPLSYIRGDDEAVVIWETTCARPGLTLRYTIEGIGGEEKEATRMEHLNVPNDSHETHHVHRAFLSNLRAGRMIDYSVRDEETSADWAKGRLKWSAGEPKPHSPIRLAFIADNQFNLRTFRQLLGEMRRFYTSKKGGRAAPDIIVHAGDAVQNAYDLAQWQTDFSDPLHNAFSFPSLAGALPPFLYTPGNHDHDRTGGHGYTGGSPTHRALSLGQSRWIVLDSNDNSTAATEWLRTELETKEWKEAGLRIVLVHVPPFIEYWQWRAWGKPQNEWKWGRHVRTDWAPLWHEAKATLVLSGHSHAYYRGLLPHTFASSFSALKSSADDAGLVSSVREAHPNAEGTIYAVAGGAGGTLDPDRVEDWGFYTTSVPGRHHWVDIELDFDAPPAETDTYVVGEETCSSVDRLTWTARALGGETIDRFAIAARRCP